MSSENSPYIDILLKYLEQHNFSYELIDDEKVLGKDYSWGIYCHEKNGFSQFVGKHKKREKAFGSEKNFWFDKEIQKILSNMPESEFSMDYHKIFDKMIVAEVNGHFILDSGERYHKVFCSPTDHQRIIGFGLSRHTDLSIDFTDSRTEGYNNYDLKNLLNGNKMPFNSWMRELPKYFESKIIKK